MNDPLLDMGPGDRDWWATLAAEAEDFSVALYQDDDRRAERKGRELHNALHKMGWTDPNEGADL